MKQIKTALLSYGMSGRVFHAPFIHVHDSFELVGSWERSKKLIRNDYPGVTSYASIESILQDESVELVIVNTPTYSHYEYAKLSLEANKHVVVEKAFTTTVAEAAGLKKLADDRGLVLSVFQNRRWDSDFLTVKKIMNDRLLGDIVEATFSYDRYNPSLSPKSHKETPGPGAGIVYDLGPHLIDQALVLFGMPEGVFADIMITRENSRVDDYFEILLIYNNFRVRLRSGYFVREPVASFVIHGKLGSFHKIRADVQEEMLQRGITPDMEGYGVEPENAAGLLHTVVDGNVRREWVIAQRGNYLNYYDGVYRSIREGLPVEVSSQDGLKVMRIIEAAFESRKENKVMLVSH